MTAPVTSNPEPVTVVIAGEPVAKARPRLTRRGIAYTPAHTRKYEAHGRLAAQLAMGDRPPIEAPVRLELVADLPIPACWSGRKRALAITGDVLPTCRPDVDNYVKAAIDSLNEIVVRDDSQIVEISARKRILHRSKTDGRAPRCSRRDRPQQGDAGRHSRGPQARRPRARPEDTGRAHQPRTA